MLIAYEIGLLKSTTGVQLGAIVSTGFAVWLLATREASPLIPLLGAVITLALGFSYASNLFGHDGHALRRYILLTPDWAGLFSAKNLAFCLVTVAELVPLVLAAIIRLPPASTLSLLGSTILVILLLILWGNISSMLFPSAGSREGVFMNQVAPLAAWGAPFAIHRSIAAFGSMLFLAAVCAGAICCFALYRLMLRGISSHFEEEAGAVLERM